MINSRKLSDLRPGAEKKFRFWTRACAIIGIDVLIYCTYRDFEQQNALYAIGRTKKGKKVTNAKGGKSWHQYRLAVDAVPMVGGKPQWDDKMSYAKMGLVARKLGIEWAGDWKRFKELAHFQYTNGYDMDHFRDGGTL